jgi:hypothetical protein
VFYLSKFTGLAPLSLIYTHDKQTRVGVNLKTSVLAVLHTVLTILGIIGAQCYVLCYFNQFHNEGQRKKNVLLLEFLTDGIAGVTILAMSVTRIRKEMEKVLYKMYFVDETLYTNSIF